MGLSAFIRAAMNNGPLSIKQDNGCLCAGQRDVTKRREDIAEIGLGELADFAGRSRIVRVQCGAYDIADSSWLSLERGSSGLCNGRQWHGVSNRLACLNLIGAAEGCIPISLETSQANLGLLTMEGFLHTHTWGLALAFLPSFTILTQTLVCQFWILHKTVRYFSTSVQVPQCARVCLQVREAIGQQI